MMPHFQTMPGVSLAHAVVLPPGARVAAYVRSGGARAVEENLPPGDIVTTLNAGLARCRSGIGDVVVVLPDHAEDISSADQMSDLVAGTRIIGIGNGNLRPTFTWTAAAATFLLDVANVSIENCILNLAGPRAAGTAITTAAPITVSAAGCRITGCDIHFGFDADQKVTIGVTTTAAADYFEFSNNYCFSETAAECTTFLRLVGADHALISGNVIVGASSNVDVGLVQFITTDSLAVRMLDNHIRNNKAASTAAVIVSAGATSSSGYIHHLYMTVLANAAAQLVLGDASGAWADSVAAFTFSSHVYVANLAGERMANVTPVSA